MLYCLEQNNLLVGQLSIPYFLYLTYAHTRLFLSLPTQSSVRKIAAGRVSSQLLVSHEPFWLGKMHGHS